MGKLLLGTGDTVHVSCERNKKITGCEWLVIIETMLDTF